MTNTNNPFASCQYKKCKSRKTCKRYNKDNVEINFSTFYDKEKDKCLYYIEIEKDVENVEK